MNFRDWLNENPSRGGFALLTTVPGAWTSAEELHEQLHRYGAPDNACLLLSMASDAWLGMTEQWKHDCVDCHTDSTTERYMVHDHVWAAAGMCPFGFLCVGCIEQRLGRRLHAADFLNVGLNHDPKYERSARLVDRLSA